MSGSVAIPPGSAASLDDWAQALRRVFDDPGRLQPTFQPIVTLDRDEVAAYELLARFDGPAGARPVLWFAAAERLGALAGLEAMVLRAGLEARSALPPNCFLTVNVAPESLVTPAVQEVLGAARPLHGVVIELTERRAVEDYDALTAALDALRGEGAVVAVDDAGAGYASLRHVMSLRPEFLKLDRALVAGLDVDPAKQALIEAMGGFASRIDAWVIAEGVERPAEREALRRLGVPLAQGFLFGRPSARMEPARVTRPRLAPLSPRGLERRLDRTPPLAHDGLAAAPARFAGVPACRFLPVVDDLGRPLGLLPREAAAGSALRPALRVLAEEPPWTLAERAMTRPADERFDPLVVCDQLGRYVALLDVEALVGHLAAITRPDPPTEECP